MRETICSVCGKHFLSNTSGKYCSDECRRKALSKKSAEYQKSKRSRVQICVDCGKEYPTRRGQTKYCEECRRKHYICPICGGIKENIKQYTCKKCSTTTRICPICGKAFVAKGVKKICSRECKLKQKRDYYLDNRKLKTNICNKCGKEFISRDGLGHQLCKHCCDNKNICPNCGGYKKSSASHCHHCSELSRTYICEKCGKKCTGVKQTKYCEDCYPRCKLCGKKCDNIYEECCSRSCAMKLKWTREESAKKMIQNIINMNNGKYNKGNKSSVNDIWLDLFKNEGFNPVQEFKLKNEKGYEGLGQYCLYDFKIGNTLIEINPTISHNSTKPYRNGGEPKHPKYHINKMQLGTDNGYRVISIYDRDVNNKFKERLISQLKDKQIITNVYTRTPTKKQVDQFLKGDIYEKYTGGLYYWYEGIYHEGELIGLIGIGSEEGGDGEPLRILGNILFKQGIEVDAETMRILFTKIVKKRKRDYIISESNISKTDIYYMETMGFYTAIEDDDVHCINTKTRKDKEDNEEGYIRVSEGINCDGEDIGHIELKEGYVEVYTEGTREWVRGG